MKIKQFFFFCFESEFFSLERNLKVKIKKSEEGNDNDDKNFFNRLFEKLL